MRRLLLILASVLVLTSGCEGAFDQLSDPGSGGGGETHNITYRVEGPSSADITYQNENQDTSQENGVSLPWTYSMTAQEFDFAYVSAQNSGGGTITCTLEIDGRVAESNSSKGEFAICTASGNV